MKGTLYLIPNTLGNEDIQKVIPEFVKRITLELRVFFVEDLRSARRYLKKLDRSVDIDGLTFHILNEHTLDKDIPAMIGELKSGHSAGIISEAGIPCVADPGATLVSLAHKNGIRVVPLTGPSSLFLALMSSGFNGQAFRFSGYLPVKQHDRIKQIKELERRVVQHDETQIFMETPYRNQALFEDLLRHCQPSTMLCIAVDIALDSEEIQTRTIAAWRTKKHSFHKRPAVFLLGRA